jgi:hypothetical protein
MYKLNYAPTWGHEVEKKLYLGVGEQKRLTTTGLIHFFFGNFILWHAIYDEGALIVLFCWS